LKLSALVESSDDLRMAENQDELSLKKKAAKKPIQYLTAEVFCCHFS
jgi:hypothetical protein